MARPRKPLEAKADKRIRRQGDGRSDVRRIMPIAIPAPPAGLSQRTLEWWDTFWNSELVAATHARTDEPAVGRLASLYELREFAFRQVMKHPMIEGSQNQLVENPYGRAMSRYDAEIRQLEDRFGLTPRSRLNLGLQLGQAKRQLEDLMGPVGEDDNDDGEDFRDVIEL